jgi:hypothetical protein
VGSREFQVTGNMNWLYPFSSAWSSPPESSQTPNDVLDQVAHPAAPPRLTQQGTLRTQDLREALNEAESEAQVGPATTAETDTEEDESESELARDVPTDPSDVLDYKRRITELEHVVRDLHNRHSVNKFRSKQAYERQINQLEKTKWKARQLETELNRAREECDRLSKDNRALREYIDLTRDRQPLHTDDEYIARIEQLNEITKSWIAALWKAKQLESVETDRSIILKVLDMTYYGRSIAEAVRESPIYIDTILENRQRRMSLIRQLVWAELTEVILAPFCFGLGVELDEMLSNVVDTICGEGSYVLSRLR